MVRLLARTTRQKGFIALIFLLSTLFCIYFSTRSTRVHDEPVKNWLDQLIDYTCDSLSGSDQQQDSNNWQDLNFPVSSTVNLLNSYLMSNLPSPPNLTSSLSVSSEELSFPLAFALSVYESHVFASHLFNLIYRPHNLYCIHFDAKTSPEVELRFTNYVKDRANHNPTNVIILTPEDRVDVQWGTFSVLDMALKCARALTDRHIEVDWKYFINVNEKELPLRTNWELVVALKALNGSSSVEGFVKERWNKRFPTIKPFENFKWVKGSYLTALSHQFVQFALEDWRAKRLLTILADPQTYGARIPDELFFSTLAYNPQLGTPGGCLQQNNPDPLDPQSWHVARYVDWDARRCASNVSRHNVCVLGLGDLPVIKRRPELFVNKFLPSVEPLAYACLERWLVGKLEAERNSGCIDRSFDESFYSRLYCTTNHT